jgi:fructose/tagatose bisphosphate aldolase
VAVVRAAEEQRSPLIIQVFPWAIKATDGLLVRAAADAASRATVPIAIHLDHCQDEALVRLAADTLPFDSIMVDMSHYEKDENLAKTKELVAYCHARGITAEAESGRIDGAEDGKKSNSSSRPAWTFSLLQSETYMESMVRMGHTSIIRGKATNDSRVGAIHTDTTVQTRSHSKASGGTSAYRPTWH